ncbi:MAG: sulfite exporter TauE/SafE family protein [Fimbriimonadales bacterium]|nr:sulfite exporter TauE/SafE family protein [Fimbriimonadales bacterium]
MLPDLSAGQWLCVLLAAAFVGLSKTGVPGAGVVIVPLMAVAFSGRSSPGALLPMLLVGDLFAVGWYRRHTRWPILAGLAPWVLLGVAAGAATLWWMGASAGLSRAVERLIALLVLAMVALHLLRRRLGDRLQPHSLAGRALAGGAAGYATTVSNAAGPVTNLYLAAAGIPKEEFMGTAAWFYLLFNLLKVPLFAWLSWLQPQAPMITASSLAMNALAAPAILVGALLGRAVFRRLSQAWFEDLVIGLATATCVYLLLR